MLTPASHSQDFPATKGRCEFAGAYTLKNDRVAGNIYPDNTLACYIFLGPSSGRLNFRQLRHKNLLFLLKKL
jgi:hypothetical protein